MAPPTQRGGPSALKARPGVARPAVTGKGLGFGGKGVGGKGLGSGNRRHRYVYIATLHSCYTISFWNNQSTDSDYRKVAVDTIRGISESTRGPPIDKAMAAKDDLKEGKFVFV